MVHSELSYWRRSSLRLPRQTLQRPYCRSSLGLFSRLAAISPIWYTSKQTNFINNVKITTWANVFHTTLQQIENALGFFFLFFLARWKLNKCRPVPQMQRRAGVISFAATVLLQQMETVQPHVPVPPFSSCELSVRLISLCSQNVGFKDNKNCNRQTDRNHFCITLQFEGLVSLQQGGF